MSSETHPTGNTEPLAYGQREGKQYGRRNHMSPLFGSPPKSQSNNGSEGWISSKTSGPPHIVKVYHGHKSSNPHPSKPFRQGDYTDTAEEERGALVMRDYTKLNEADEKWAPGSNIYTIAQLLLLCPYKVTSSKLPLPSSVKEIYPDIFIETIVSGEEPECDDELLQPALREQITPDIEQAFKHPILVGGIHRSRPPAAHHKYEHYGGSHEGGPDSSETYNYIKRDGSSGYSRGSRGTSRGRGGYRQREDSFSQDKRSHYYSRYPREGDKGGETEDLWATPDTSAPGVFDEHGNFVSAVIKGEDDMDKDIRGLSGKARESRFANLLCKTAELNIIPDEEKKYTLPFYEQWTYCDPSGTIQGPFKAKQMNEWTEAGFFTPSLLVKPDVNSCLSGPPGLESVVKLSSGMTNTFNSLAKWIERYEGKVPWCIAARSIRVAYASVSENPFPDKKGEQKNITDSAIVASKAKEGVFETVPQTRGVATSAKSVTEIEADLEVRPRTIEAKPVPSKFAGWGKDPLATAPSMNQLLQEENKKMTLESLDTITGKGHEETKSTGIRKSSMEFAYQSNKVNKDNATRSSIVQERTVLTKGIPQIASEQVDSAIPWMDKSVKENPPRVENINSIVPSMPAQKLVDEAQAIMSSNPWSKNLKGGPIAATTAYSNPSRSAQAPELAHPEQQKAYISATTPNAWAFIAATTKSKPVEPSYIASAGKPQPADTAAVSIEMPKMKEEKPVVSAQLYDWVKNELSNLAIKDLDVSTLVHCIQDLPRDEIAEVLSGCIGSPAAVNQFIIGFMAARDKFAKGVKSRATEKKQAGHAAAPKAKTNNKDASDDGFELVERKQRKSKPAADGSGTKPPSARKVVGLN